MKRIIAALLVLALFAGTISAGTVTVTEKKWYPGAAAPLMMFSARVKITGTYTSGGEALTAATLGLTDIIFLHATADTVTSAGYSFFYDDANAKMELLAISVATDPAALDCEFSAEDHTAADPGTVSVNIPSTAGTITRAEASGTVTAICRVIGWGY